MVRVVLGLFLIYVAAASARETPAFGPELGTKEECLALKDSATAFDCVESLKRMRMFRVTAEEYDQVKAGQHAPLWNTSMPSKPTALISADGIETITTISIRGADTLRTVVIVPARSDKKLQEKLESMADSQESMAGSLRFMAILEGLGVAAGLILLLVFK